MKITNNNNNNKSKLSNNYFVLLFVDNILNKFHKNRN